MKKNISYVAIIFLVFLSTSGFAKNESKPMASVKQAVEQKQVKVFSGIIKSVQGGTVLVTENKNYLLIGGDFSLVTSKKVKVFGEIIKKGQDELIKVTKMELDRQ